MIEFTDVVKSYREGNDALKGINMQIEDGEFCFLVGPSGSGKSTIIKLITGELKPTSGTVHVNGYSLERIRKREIPYLRRTVGVVFQDFRLIYQLPTTLCEIFLGEVFKKNSIDSLDQETLFTINKFFENNLNVSETSRKLFVHRNTLVYRLEKIKKLTGLDLRQFDHAIVFKVALMVRKYLSSRDIY